MVLECVMLCLDNSEFSRNGDFSPSRFQSQVEACTLLAGHKLQGNPETSVGLLSLAGPQLIVHVSPCRSNGSIMSSLSKDVRIRGLANFLGGLKTAALALKNRQNKNQRQRIIAFVGSPVTDDVSDLIRLGRTFKKNNIAVDLINFGAENAANENPEKLEKFIEAVNNAENSHLVNIPPGPHILADLILTSPICVEGGAPAASAARAAPQAGESGDLIDPNMDPEMAMAIRMSMEEERQRQQRAAGNSQTAAAQPAAAAATGEVAMEDDEEAMLAQAIALSMQQENQATQANDQTSATPETPATPAPSTAPVAPAAPAASSSADVDMTLLQDPDFLSGLLNSVGAPSGSLDSLLDSLQGADKEKEEKKDKK